MISFSSFFTYRFMTFFGNYIVICFPKIRVTNRLEQREVKISTIFLLIHDCDRPQKLLQFLLFLHPNQSWFSLFPRKDHISSHSQFSFLSETFISRFGRFFINIIRQFLKPLLYEQYLPKIFFQVIAHLYSFSFRTIPA